jgi:hypothetical protein
MKSKLIKQLKRRAKRLWDGNASDLDLYYAALDPRQLHFSFYAEPDPSTNRAVRGRKQPSRASRDAEQIDEVAG